MQRRFFLSSVFFGETFKRSFVFPLVGFSPASSSALIGGVTRENAQTTRRLPMYSPKEELLPYQRDWVNDDSRWKFGLMSRQVGKDFSCAFEGVRQCCHAEQE